MSIFFNIKFKLVNGDIYLFKYYQGYSELLESLEVEKNMCIDVIEPFTKEEFEEAHINYINYMEMKKIIGEIKRKEGNYDIEFFEKNYDLNNKILKWLCVQETKEEKEIFDTLQEFKEKNKKLQLSDIKIDNIILYSLFDIRNQIKFLYSCRNSLLRVAKWLYYYHNSGDDVEGVACPGIDIMIDEDEECEIFCCVCENSSIEMLEWVYSIYDIKLKELTNEKKDSDNIDDFDDKYCEGFLHKFTEGPFRWCCQRGNLKNAKWLYEKSIEINSKINIHADGSSAFIWACENGHLDVAKWIYSLDSDFSNYDFNSINDVFSETCINKQLNVAQWLFTFINIDNFNKYELLYELVEKGNLEICKWLYSTGKFDFNEYIDELESIAISKYNDDMIKWLHKI